MMYFCLKTFAGDCYFVSVSNFSDFNNLFSKLGLNDDDISELVQFTVHSLED